MDVYETGKIRGRRENEHSSHLSLRCKAVMTIATMLKNENFFETLLSSGKAIGPDLLRVCSGIVKRERGTSKERQGNSG